MIGLPFEDAFATELGKVYQDLPRNPLIFYSFLGVDAKSKEIRDWCEEVGFAFEARPIDEWGENVVDCFFDFRLQPELATLFKLKFCNV